MSNESNPNPNFNPRSPCGERPSPDGGSVPTREFQSTLSLRRATFRQQKGELTRMNFNPRSPCGERPVEDAARPGYQPISIHALLAESDDFAQVNGYKLSISIHALLAESDEDGHNLVALHVAFQSTLSLRRATMKVWGTADAAEDFNPRSPCGERLCCLCPAGSRQPISIHALLAESDCPHY